MSLFLPHNCLKLFAAKEIKARIKYLDLKDPPLIGFSLIIRPGKIEPKHKEQACFGPTLAKTKCQS